MKIMYRLNKIIYTYFKLARNSSTGNAHGSKLSADTRGMQASLLRMGRVADNAFTATTEVRPGPPGAVLRETRLGY